MSNEREKFEKEGGFIPDEIDRKKKEEKRPFNLINAASNGLYAEIINYLGTPQVDVSRNDLNEAIIALVGFEDKNIKYNEGVFLRAINSLVNYGKKHFDDFSLDYQNRGENNTALMAFIKNTSLTSYSPTNNRDIIDILYTDKNINLPDSKGKTPLEYAREQKSESLQDILKDYGATAVQYEKNIEKEWKQGGISPKVKQRPLLNTRSNNTPQAAPILTQADILEKMANFLKETQGMINSGKFDKGGRGFFSKKAAVGVAELKNAYVPYPIWQTTKYKDEVVKLFDSVITILEKSQSEKVNKNVKEMYSNRLQQAQEIKKQIENDPHLGKEKKTF